MPAANKGVSRAIHVAAAVGKTADRTACDSLHGAGRSGRRQQRRTARRYQPPSAVCGVGYLATPMVHVSHARKHPEPQITQPPTTRFWQDWHFFGFLVVCTANARPDGQTAFMPIAPNALVIRRCSASSAGVAPPRSG